MEAGVRLPGLTPAPPPIPGWTWARELVSPGLSFLTCRMETVETDLIPRELVGPGEMPLSTVSGSG